MIFADINTANSDRHGKNWGVLIKGNNAEIAPNFDYDMTFSQNQYAMKGIAESIETKNKKMIQRIIGKYNVKRFTQYLKETIGHTGLELGEGQRRFLVDTEIEKYNFKDTSKYIRSELGEEEYSKLLSKVNIENALPKMQDKDYEIYSLIAKLHHCNAKNKIVSPTIDNQER